MLRVPNYEHLDQFRSRSLVCTEHNQRRTLEHCNQLENFHCVFRFLTPYRSARATLIGTHKNKQQKIKEAAEYLRKLAKKSINPTDLFAFR